jgi:hypothetical protein
MHARGMAWPRFDRYARSQGPGECRSRSWRLSLMSSGPQVRPIASIGPTWPACRTCREFPLHALRTGWSRRCRLRLQQRLVARQGGLGGQPRSTLRPPAATGRQRASFWPRFNRLNHTGMRAHFRQKADTVSARERAALGQTPEFCELLIRMEHCRTKLRCTAGLAPGSPI